MVALFYTKASFEIIYKLDKKAITNKSVLKVEIYNLIIIFTHKSKSSDFAVHFNKMKLQICLFTNKNFRLHYLSPILLSHAGSTILYVKKILHVDLEIRRIEWNIYQIAE